MSSAHQEIRLRYKVEASVVYDGKWSVVDTFTGCPEIVEGVPLDGLATEEVDDLVELMNSRDLKARGLLKNSLG